MVNDFSFEKIVPTDEQILILYELLNEREFKISHRQSVSFENHQSFVRKNPYRAWFLVKSSKNIIGSFYVSSENTVGINVQNYNDKKLISSVLMYLKDNYKPLKAIPSVRSSDFGINVPPTNRLLVDTLDSLGAELVQLTYHLPK
jgi:hypothetical protein